MYAKVSGNNKETPAQKKLPKIYRGPTHDSFSAATGFNTPVWARRKPNSDGRHALAMACMMRVGAGVTARWIGRPGYSNEADLAIRYRQKPGADHERALN